MFNSRKFSFEDTCSKEECESLAFDDSSENLWDNFDHDDDWPPTNQSKAEATPPIINLWRKWKPAQSKFEFKTFFRSVFVRRVETKPEIDRSEKVKLGVASILETFQKVDEFLEKAVAPLRCCAQENCFPQMLIPVLEISPIKKSSHFSLPVLEVWTATYLLQSFQRTPRTEAFFECSKVSFPDLLFSLCWEMEIAKLTGHHFYSKFSKFVSAINKSLEELKRILKKSDFVTTDSTSIEKQTIGEHKLKIDTILKTGRKKSKPHMHILRTNSTFEFNFPILFSVRKFQRNGYMVPREFSRLCPDTKETIINELFQSSTKSLMELHTVLRKAANQIFRKGVLQRAARLSAGRREHVTVASSLKNLTVELQQIVSSKHRRKLVGKAKETEIFNAAVNLFAKWNIYVRYSQWVLLTFYELCDMINLCYSFSFHHIHMSVPESYLIRKYVSTSLKQMPSSSNSKSGPYRYNWSEDLKEIHKNSAISELLEKAITSGSLPKRKSKNAVWYHKKMLSTRYHRALQQYPLEVGGQYDIALRTAPDLERVDSFMVLPCLRREYSESS